MVPRLDGYLVKKSNNSQEALYRNSKCPNPNNRLLLRFKITSPNEPQRYKGQNPVTPLHERRIFKKIDPKRFVKSPFKRDPPALHEWKGIVNKPCLKASNKAAIDHGNELKGKSYPNKFILGSVLLWINNL
jgi:hypothetical protein